MQQNKYDKEPLTAVEAQRLAQEIAFGPIVFQVSRLMLKFGIFQLLADVYGERPTFTEYIMSTHPSTEKRIERLEKLL